jgi:hypothetical protein
MCVHTCMWEHEFFLKEDQLQRENTQNLKSPNHGNDLSQLCSKIYGLMFFRYWGKWAADSPSHTQKQGPTCTVMPMFGPSQGWVIRWAEQSTLMLEAEQTTVAPAVAARSALCFPDWLSYSFWSIWKVLLQNNCAVASTHNLGSSMPKRHCTVLFWVWNAQLISAECTPEGLWSLVWGLLPGWLVRGVLHTWGQCVAWNFAG